MAVKVIIQRPYIRKNILHLCRDKYSQKFHSIDQLIVFDWTVEWKQCRNESIWICFDSIRSGAMQLESNSNAKANINQFANFCRNLVKLHNNLQNLISYFWVLFFYDLHLRPPAVVVGMHLLLEPLLPIPGGILAVRSQEIKQKAFKRCASPVLGALFLFHCFSFHPLCAMLLCDHITVSSCLFFLLFLRMHSLRTISLTAFRLDWDPFRHTPSMRQCWSSSMTCSWRHHTQRTRL